MGLIVTEINELRQRLKNFDAGKIDVDELTAAVSVYAQTEKRMRLFLKALAMSQNNSDDRMLQMIGRDTVDESDEPYSRTADRGK